MSPAEYRALCAEILDRACGPAARDTPTVINLISLAPLDPRDRPRAVAYARRAANLPDGLELHPLQHARIVGEVGMILLHAGREREAIPYWREAARLYRLGGEKRSPWESDLADAERRGRADAFTSRP